ncbi:aminotransferase class IV [Sphingobacterium rhinopitheci]|uniref:aminotransferase class IV n=1 Tax=Sphingobacterium rhinopitheci TaxID=2781960 RepID=UPI001F52A667|nr:aminotransferase class IV [Sphingobacterium rhinopitheci]MCI0921342.1 aminotransferase class IV family protein [Sphingobacterium rhinopitheci]
MQSPYVFFNGKLIPESEAQLGINDLSIVRGYGIFDYFKTVNNIPFFVEDNIDRLFNSARLMDLIIPYSKEEINTQIQQLIATNNIPDSGIKILVTGGYSPDGYSIAAPNFIITQQPFSRNSTLETAGIKLHLFDYHRAFSLVKSIDYVMGIQALKVAKSKGADDVVYFQNGLLSECPRANIFLVTADNKLLTPGKDVLEGITRKKIIEMVAGKYEVELRDVTLEDILNAKEAFITSTTKNITPVTAIIEHKEFGHGAGPITKELQIQLEGLIYNS